MVWPRSCSPSLTVGLLPALAGCVGTGVGVPWVDPENGDVPATFEDIQSVVFTAKCAVSGCHTGGAAAKGLALDEGRSLDGLVDVEAVEVEGMSRVATFAPEDSYLVVKLAYYDARRVGSRMPRTGPPYLSDSQVHAIERWIRAGARDDWVDGEDTAVPLVVTE